MKSEFKGGNEMENNFKFEMQKLCDMQMELWKDVKK